MTLPYSSEHGKKLVDRALLRFNNLSKEDPFFTQHRILDIGAGSGTYSTLYGSNLLDRKKFVWDAVEIWEPYVEKFELKDKYDNVHVTDAISFFKNNSEFYDIIFMGDVVEHMTKEQALELVELAQQVCHMIIISIPIIHYPQDEYEGNPYEAHIKDDWSTQEALESFSSIVSYGVESEIGVFFIEGVNDSALGLPGHDLAKILSPKIGVYSIGKNEMEFADRFVDSIMEADQIAICDTGSDDGTFEHLRALRWDCISLRSNPDRDENHFIVTKISLQPFRFDDARNAAMSLLRPDIDVCVSIDFDEYMEPGWADVLRQEATLDLQRKGYIVDRWNHRFKTVWNWKESDEGLSEPVVSEHWHERIHTRNNYLWKLPVHEVLVKVSGAEEIKWLGGFLQIQKPDTSKSRSSYLPMLQKSVQEDPGRWKTWSFLAADLMANGRNHEAFEALDKAKKCRDADVAYICNQKSRFHQQIGQIREAVSEMSNACMIAPHLREYKVYAARIHLAAGDKVAAESMFRMAEAVKDRTFGYEYDASVWGEGFESLRKEIEQ
jgi:hypothetical protein